MKMLDLLPIGDLDARLLRSLAPALADSFRVPCRILDERLDPRFAFHPERGQHHSSELLQAMQPYAADGAWRVLGVTSADLYIPILTFVFGEAQMGGPCEEKISGATTEEMIGAGMEHIKAAHPEMAADIEAMPKDDPKMVAWFETFTKTWEATPENA